MLQSLRRQCGEVGLAGQATSQATDGVLDAALLPRGVGVTEEGLNAQGLAQAVVVGELGAVIEGDGLSKFLGERGEQGLNVLRHGCGGLVGLTQDPDQARGPLMQREECLAVSGKKHQVGFPVAGVGAVVGLGGALRDRHAVGDVQGGAAASAPSEAALALGTRQVPAPGVVLGARDLLGGPAAPEQVQDQGLQLKVAKQLAAAPTPSVSLLPGISRAVTLGTGIALQLPSNARWRAIQTCRHLPDRLPGVATPGNLTSLLNRELTILGSHRNTPLIGCCTSFVNSGNPGSFLKTAGSPLPRGRRRGQWKS